LEIQTGCSDYSLLDIVELLLSFVYWRNVLLACVNVLFTNWSH